MATESSAKPQRRHELQRLFSAFPRGWPGVGLLLLRLALGMTASVESLFYFSNSRVSSTVSLALGILLVVSGLAVLIGFVTPVAGLADALIAGGMATSWLPIPEPGVIDSKLTAALVACVAVALVLLGPGAFSLDAKLFGRREIVIPRRPSHPSP